MSVLATFNGMGIPAPGLVTSALRVLVVYIPLAVLGNWLWGLTGLFVATATSNCVVAAIAYYWLRNTLKRDDGGFQQRRV